MMQVRRKLKKGVMDSYMNSRRTLNSLSSVIGGAKKSRYEDPLLGSNRPSTDGDSLL